MPTTLTASFDTRREAEMTVERLVQEQGIDRAAIVIATAGDDNSAGEEVAGADTGAPGSDEDAALNGRVTVTVDVADDAQAGEIKAAFAEFDGDTVSAG